MAIIDPTGRPAIALANGTYVAPPGEWSILQTYRANLEAAIAAVGRVELEGHPYINWVGTAFLVGPGRIMTARNLVQTYAEGLGDANLELKPGLTASFAMRPELGGSLRFRIKIASVRFIHPFYDVALCELDANEWAVHVQELRDRVPIFTRGLTLSANPPLNLNGKHAAVISFSNADPRNAPADVRDIYGVVSEVLYLQPGQVRELSELEGKQVLVHDCSTLGGSSGAPLVELDTGHVLGIHYAGQYHVGNYVVPSWELACDDRVRQHGINFADDPPWMYQWTQAEVLSQSEEASSVIVQPVEDAAPSALDTEMEYFEQDELYKIRDLLIKAGFGKAERQPLLFVAMNTTYTASLPAQGSPDIRLVTVLDTLNRTERLTDGELPFETFLLNAISNAGVLPQAGQLEGYLKKLRARVP